MITSESSNKRDIKHNVKFIETLALKHSGIITILNFYHSQLFLDNLDIKTQHND